MEEKDKIVFIKVRASTREELKRHGIKGDTYDTIINQLIEVSERGIFRVEKKNGRPTD